MIVNTVIGWLRQQGQTTSPVKTGPDGRVCTIFGTGLNRKWIVVCINPSAEASTVFYYALGLAVASYQRTEPPSTVGLVVPDTPPFRQELRSLDRHLLMELPCLRILLVRDGEGVFEAPLGMNAENLPETRGGPSEEPADEARRGPGPIAKPGVRPRQRFRRRAELAQEPVHPSMRTRALPAQPLDDPVRTVAPATGLDYDGLDLPRLGSQFSVLDRMPKHSRK